MTKIKDLSIVVTAYNEEDNIETVLNDITKELEKHKIKYEIIAVDNGSRDNTQDKIKKFPNKNVRLAVVPVNIGYGNGILTGLKAANARYVGYMWGDNEVSADNLPKLYRLLETNQADLVKVARTVRWYGIYRKLQSKMYIFLTRALFGKISRDVNGCPKIMKSEYLHRMNLASKKWFLDTEVMVMAKKLGMRVSEIDVEYRKRLGGKSNVKFTTALSFLASLVAFRIRMLMM